MFALAAVSSVVLGTIYPLYYDYMTGQKISIGPFFYIATFVPLYIPMLFMAGIFGYMGWNSKLKPKIIIYFVIAFIISAIIVYLIETRSYIAMFALLAACFLLIYTLHELYIFWQSKQIATNKLAMYISHLGLAGFVLCVVLNACLQYEADFVGGLDHKAEIDGFIFKLQDIKYSKNTEFVRQIAKFQITDKAGNEISNLAPEHRLYNIEKVAISKTHIHSFLFYDLYIALSRVQADKVHAKIYYKPAMAFLWLSLFIMFLGPLLRVK